MYAALTDAHGVARLVDVDQARPPIADAEVGMDFAAEPTVVREAFFGFTPLVLPAPGDYRLQLRHEGELLCERRLLVGYHPPPQQQAAPPSTPSAPPPPQQPPPEPPPGQAG